MLLAGLAILFGLIVGLVLPPRPHRFARLTMGWLPLLAAGIAGQIVASGVDGRGGRALLLVAYGSLVAFALANLHVPGTGVVAIGLALNALVIALNGGMPVHPQALVDAGVIERGELPTVTLAGHRHLEDADRLTILDDRVPMPLGRQVVSFGDLILAVGAADVVAHISRRRRRRLAHAAAPEPKPVAAAVPAGPVLPRADGPVTRWRRSRAAALARARLAHPAVDEQVLIDLREWLPDDEDLYERIEHVRTRVTSMRS